MTKENNREWYKENHSQQNHLHIRFQLFPADTLSDKIEVYDKENDDNFVRVKDIKEFIKRLKEGVITSKGKLSGTEEFFHRIIDKLAGDKLK